MGCHNGNRKRERERERERERDLAYHPKGLPPAAALPSLAQMADSECKTNLRAQRNFASVVHLAASLQASLVSCLLVNPLDVVATRLQAAPAAAGGGAPASIVACVLRGGLYGGLAANAARVVPHTCLTFSIVEALRSRLT